MEKQYIQQLKIDLVKTVKQFYVENGLDESEMKYFLGLVLCDLGFIADYYDEELFKYSRVINKTK